jgi:hypothetical protein
MLDDEMLNDEELDQVLRSWRAPVAPPIVHRPRWRRWFTGSIRVPVPVAVCLVVIVAAGFVVMGRPRVVYREVLVPMSSISFQGLQPVDELRPRIIRRKDAEN